MSVKKSAVIEMTKLETGPWAIGRTVAPFPLPINPNSGKPIYISGAVLDVYNLCSRPNGATVAELKRAMNSDVALYPVTRHAGPAGRGGWRPNVIVDGKSALPNIASLADTSRVAIVSYTGVDSFVSARHPRSHPGSVTALVSARSAQSSDVPLASLPAKQINAVVDAALAAKSTAKTTAKRGKK